ncbi:unnamed protein product [Cuscuta europaea]|uniref:Uncharacterized protein n=1 Tax=Cuscuta europaea TaxID=41803 RepID=A0A9P0Z7L9_CUSEU|nr:unnamed protein product [Cuscuta europaea]
MERGRASVDMGNLRRNRTKEIARNHPRSRKGKGGAGSSSQTRDGFDADYNQRYGDAMSDEQLEQLLQQNQGGFFHQQDIPQTIDEEELEDDDAEERDPRTVEDEVHGTPDDEELKRKRKWLLLSKPMGNLNVSLRQILQKLKTSKPRYGMPLASIATKSITWEFLEGTGAP